MIEDILNLKIVRANARKLNCYNYSRQWTENEYFCCHDPNPQTGRPKRNCLEKFPDTFQDNKWIIHRETCGVPHSCCIPLTNNETMRNLQCGDTLQDEVNLFFILASI